MQIDGKWGYIDKEGAIAIPPRFSMAQSFNENLASVLVGELWGFLGKDGKLHSRRGIPRLVSSPRAYALSSSAAKALQTKAAAAASLIAWATIILPRFSCAGKFDDGFANVVDRKISTYITHTGLSIWHSKSACSSTV